MYGNYSGSAGPKNFDYFQYFQRIMPKIQRMMSGRLKNQTEVGGSVPRKRYDQWNYDRSMNAALNLARMAGTRSNYSGGFGGPMGGTILNPEAIMSQGGFLGAASNPTAAAPRPTGPFLKTNFEQPVMGGMDPTAAGQALGYMTPTAPTDMENRMAGYSPDPMKKYRGR